MLCKTVVSRDKLSGDDCIGTYYLPMSEISGQGEEGWYMYKKRLNILFISPGSAVSETNFSRGT